MASRLTRAWGIRVAVVMAALCVPLLVAGGAQASIAGGNPSTTTQHPDVRSATAVDATDVQVCFDKTLQSSSAVLSDPTRMHLVGYNAFSNFLDPLGATLVTANNQCINLAFNSHGGTLDLGQYTAVAIDAGAVTGGAQPNLGDSVTLSSSTTHNGTAGLSSGPDLVGPAPVASPANSIAFVFDQSIDPLSVRGSTTSFWYENAAGNFCFSTNAVQANATTIIATFPTATGATCNDTIIPAPSVTNARRAGVLGGVLTNMVGPDALLPVFNAPQGTNMPNAANGGATTIASLVSASLNTSNGTDVSFNFDHPINATSLTDPTQYHVLLASGDNVDADSLTQGGPNTVVATFDGMNFFDEYAIQAYVDRNAAAATTGCTVNGAPPPPFICGSDGTNTYENTPGAVPIGGNPGAFSRGFTTAPDVYMVAFNHTTNVVSVFLDQRPIPGAGGVAGVRLIDATGNVVGNPTNIAIPSFPNPGPVQITMDVNPSVMALNPVQVQLFGGLAVSGVNGFCELITTLGPDGCSLPQVVQQTGSGVRIASVKHVKHAKPAKHATKRHKARKSHKR